MPRAMTFFGLLIVGFSRLSFGDDVTCFDASAFQAAKTVRASSEVSKYLNKDSNVEISKIEDIGGGVGVSENWGLVRRLNLTGKVDFSHDGKNVKPFSLRLQVEVESGKCTVTGISQPSFN